MASILNNLVNGLINLVQSKNINGLFERKDKVQKTIWTAICVLKIWYITKEE